MSDTTSKNAVALIMGAGDAIGSAIAKQFALEGFTVCMARRNGEKLDGAISWMREQGLSAHGFSCDAREED